MDPLGLDGPEQAEAHHESTGISHSAWTPNAEEITGFGFYVTWGGDSDTPYEMDITLDDLSFME